MELHPTTPRRLRRRRQHRPRQARRAPPSRRTRPRGQPARENLAFHLGGPHNHSVFWNNLFPPKARQARGELAAAIDDHSAARRRPQHFSATPTPSRAPLVHPRLGLHRPAPDHRPALRQQGNISIGLTPCSCSTCGNTPSTSTTERQGRLRQRLLEHRQLGRRRRPLHQGDAPIPPDSSSPLIPVPHSRLRTYRTPGTRNSPR